MDRVGVEPTPVDFRSTASTELASDPKRKPPAFHKTSGLKSIYTYIFYVPHNLIKALQLIQFFIFKQN